MGQLQHPIRIQNNKKIRCDFNEEFLSLVEAILCMKYCMSVNANIYIALKAGAYCYV